MHYRDYQPIDSHSYVLHSSHPRHVKNMIPFSRFLRLKRLRIDYSDSGEKRQRRSIYANLCLLSCSNLQYVASCNNLEYVPPILLFDGFHAMSHSRPQRMRSIWPAPLARSRSMALAKWIAAPGDENGYVIAAMLVDENTRFLISSFCLSLSNCKFYNNCRILARSLANFYCQ